MNIIDARKQDCPQPVILTKKAIDQGSTDIEVWVDNEIAFNNVERLLCGQGYTVHRRDDASTIILNAARSSEAVPSVQNTENGKDRYGILLMSDVLGNESSGLGEALMKAFLGTLLQRTPMPSLVALMNRSVYLATESSSAADTLREMENRGVSILVCGTCIRHFAIEDKIIVGTVSNMFEITDALLDTHKQLTIG